MWKHLKSEQKDKYKTLITNFASLSQAFSQKAESDDEGQTENYVAPIVNSKFQETVFQKAFNAVGEDIANTSYDASVVVDENHKYQWVSSLLESILETKKLPSLRRTLKIGRNCWVISNSMQISQ
ncbi:Uncharacterised protein [Streptococcus pneumoniae]|nr:Uncharacterised protein [Streptococcus pneumoniae]